MFAIIATEELDQLGQFQVKQLKNRYSDPGMFRRFIVGVDKSRMKLFDVEQSAQDDIIEHDTPVFDNSEHSERSRELLLMTMVQSLMSPTLVKNLIVVNYSKTLSDNIRCI